jgi:adenylosuccinate synthase
MKAHVIVGLQFGDECKGATVDYLCSKHKIDWVIRYNGGFQAAHNVVMADGRHHTFSQFGSGTLRGVPTYLDRHVIVDPLALIPEAEHLKSIGVPNPYSMLKMHEDCLISTIYHKNANRILDGQNGHGSCGVGIGLTRQMWSETGDGLRVEDLMTPKAVRRKLDWIRQWCQDKVLDYDKQLSSDINIDWRWNKINFLDQIKALREAARNIHPVSLEFVERRCGNGLVFEGSQGVGLDEVYGTIPHTTYSNTRPTYALELCEVLKCNPHIYGLFRPYETRHGNGPMYWEWPGLIDLSEDHNWENGSFAGKFRCGHLGLDLIRKSATICGVNELVLNCADHVDASYIDYVKSKIPQYVSIVSYGPKAEDRIQL